MTKDLITDKKGKLIVVEGMEGAGKSTAIEYIKKFFNDNKIEYIITREPGGTYVGEKIRKIIKTMPANETLSSKSELLLFYAARIQLLEEVIKPALDDGKWVVADRFELSTFAYQGGGRKLDLNVISHLSDFCLQGFKADLTIYLDISVENGLKRVFRRGRIDRIEQEPVEFFNDVASVYRDKLCTMENVKIIDASQPLNEVHNSLDKILTVFTNRYINNYAD